MNIKNKNNFFALMIAGATVISGLASCGSKSESENANDSMAADTMVENVEALPETAIATDTAFTDSALVVEESVGTNPEGSDSKGYTTTKSGLKYKVIKEGTGKSPKATDIVLVNYEGRLLDGTVFDSSYQRGEPIQFPLNQVIPGWTEGLQLMKEGATYELYIPSNLAYGPRDLGMIPPNSDLVFLVELIKVQ